MNDYNRKEQGKNVDTQLETRLTHALQEQASHVHFTPELRERVLQHLPSRHAPHMQRLFLPGLALLAVLILAVFLTTYTLQAQQTTHTMIQYRVAEVLATPAELAKGGHLISLDPTGHYLLYQPADQPGIFYTADLTDPIRSNFLVMRYANDTAWAPDGSALVATVVPEGTYLPLLALVPTGTYMHLLGHDALTASWSPSTKDAITYVTQDTSEPELWTTTPDGKPTRLLATMKLSDLVQHLAWSHNGQELALITTTGSSPSATTLSQPGRAISLMDAHTGQIQEIVSAGAFSVDNVTWSPNSRYLTYQYTDMQGKSALRTLDISTHKAVFSITPRHNLEGWNWSPDSNALVYSDGGKLQVYTLHGPEIQLPQSQGQRVSPFWLQDDRILYIHVTNGTGALEIMAPGIKSSK